MANVTVAVSDQLKKDMDSFEEVNWSAVARKVFVERVAFLKKMNELLGHSALSEEDAVKLGKKVNRSMWEKHYKKLVE